MLAVRVREREQQQKQARKKVAHNERERISGTERRKSDGSRDPTAPQIVKKAKTENEKNTLTLSCSYFAKL